MTRLFDVVSVGSTMIRLSVPPGERLETAPAYRVRTAGTESNVMVALARLGRPVGWFSRLTDNALGRRIASEIRSHGVDVSRIAWTHGGRNEVFFVEFGAEPRPTRIIYDRRDSALALITPADLDPEYLLSGRMLHLSGILPALSESCRSVVETLLKEAGERSLPVSFDVNYRAKLWSPETAEKTLGPMLAQSDVVIMTREDATGIFGLDGSPESAAQGIHQAYRPRISVLTLGPEGALAFDGERFYRSRGYDLRIVDRLGAGDAFTAGFLHGFLDDDIQKGLDYGSAMAALKLSVQGDYFISDESEILNLLGSGPGREVGR